MEVNLSSKVKMMLFHEEMFPLDLLELNFNSINSINKLKITFAPFINYYFNNLNEKMI